MYVTDGDIIRCVRRRAFSAGRYQIENVNLHGHVLETDRAKRRILNWVLDGTFIPDIYKVREHYANFPYNKEAIPWYEVTSQAKDVLVCPLCGTPLPVYFNGYRFQVGLMDCQYPMCSYRPEDVAMIIRKDNDE